MARFVLLVVLALGGLGYATAYDAGSPTEERRDLYLNQFRNDDSVAPAIRTDYAHRQAALVAGTALWLVLAGVFYSREIAGMGGRLVGRKPMDQPDPA